MEPIIKRRLREELIEIRDIMFKAQTSFKIVDYIYRTRQGIEIEVISRSNYFQWSGSTNWRIYVTEMSKLFKKGRNDHFNIHQFISKFKEGGEYRTPLIPDSSIQIWEDNLSLEKEKKLIENLVLQRDKVYSHTDKERKDIKNVFSFVDANEFLNIIKRMLSEIYPTVFSDSMDFDPFFEPVEDLKRHMAILVAEKKYWINREEDQDKEDEINYFKVLYGN
jgi:hypothetical protein